MASIPGNVATSLIGIVDRLEGRLKPFLREVVTEAAKDSVDIAHATAEDVLNTVTQELDKLKATVEQHAPTSGR